MLFTVTLHTLYLKLYYLILLKYYLNNESKKFYIFDTVFYLNGYIKCDTYLRSKSWFCTLQLRTN
jgi:hypothetical protein